jgi:Tfp pilus assembly protein PilX
MLPPFFATEAADLLTLSPAKSPISIPVNGKPRICRGTGARSKGYGLVEFLVAALIFLAISAGLMEMLGRVQRHSAYLEEMQAVMESARYALASVERILFQAGNDPHGIGIEGVAIGSATEVRIRSDLTGSARPAFPDKGDPDGDCIDSGEDITVRYNPGSRSIELIGGDSGSQPLASQIAAFSMQYLDKNGSITANGNEVFRIRVTLTAASLLPDPYMHKPFSIQLVSDIPIAVRY